MLGRLLDRPRVTLTLLFLGVGLALAGLPYLTIDFTPHDLFGRSSESARVTRKITEVFGSYDNVVLIMVEAPDVLDREVLEYIHEISLYARLQRYTSRVDSITTTHVPRRLSPRTSPAPPPDADTRTLLDEFMRAMSRREVRIDAVVEGAEVDAAEAAELRSVLADAPLLNGTLISRDHRVAAIAIALQPSVERIGEVEAAANDIDRWLAQHPRPRETKVLVTGQPHANADFARRIRADQKRLMPLSLLLCAAVLWFTFGSILGVVLPLSAVLISAGVLLGGMGWLGEPLNILNNITPLLMIVVGLSDSIHLLERYSVERRSGDDATSAVRRTLSGLTIACFLTSWTDAIGFGSLWSASTDLLARFGITAAIGVMIVYTVTVALVPPILAMWAPSLTADRRLAARAAARIAVALVPSSRTVRHWMLAIAGVVVVASLIATSRARVDTTILGLFETDDPIYQATKLAEEKLGGVSPLDVILESSQPQRFYSPAVLAAIDETQRWLEARPGVLRVSSYSDFLHEVWAVLAEDPTRRRAPFASQVQVEAFDRLLRGGGGSVVSAYINRDGSQARLSLALADIGSRDVAALGEELRTVLAHQLEAFPDISFAIGGNAYVNSYGTNKLMQDLLGSFGQTTLAIGISLLLLTRRLASIVVGLLASVLPQALVVLYMVLRGIPFNASTAMIFCISTGLAIDGCIHLLARITEEERAGGRLLLVQVRRAVERTAAGTLMNAFTLILGFAVLTSSKFLPLRQFGELSAIAALASLLGTFVLMPNLLTLVGVADGNSSSLSGEK